MKTITVMKQGMISIPGMNLVSGENQVADKLWDDVKEHPAVKKMMDKKEIVEGAVKAEDKKVEEKPAAKVEEKTEAKPAVQTKKGK